MLLGFIVFEEISCYVSRVVEEVIGYRSMVFREGRRGVVDGRCVGR